MSGADQQAALAREREERLRFSRCLDEGLLDVDMCPGQECLARGLEVFSCRCADMHEVRVRLVEQLGDGRERLRIGASSERLGSRQLHVMHSHDGVGSWDARQRLEMMAGHVAGADKGYAHRATVVTTNSLMPMRPLRRARRFAALRSSRRASTYEPTSNCCVLKP